jgi:hypothetical protein
MTIKEINARCQEFLSCLGNGKNIYQIESELELEEWREKRERKKIVDDFWGEDSWKT